MVRSRVDDESFLYRLLCGVSAAQANDSLARTIRSVVSAKSMVDMPIILVEEAFPLGVLNDGKHDRCVAIRLQHFVEYIPEVGVGQ